MILAVESQLICKINHPKKETARIDIQIPEHLNNIGIMYSGGVESTLILSLLVLYSQKIYPINITAYTVEKSDNYEYYSEKILNLDFFKQVRHITKIPNTRSDGVIREGISIVLKKPEVDILFTGVNRIPDEFIGPVGPKRDTPEFIATIPKLRCPILHLTKDYTVCALQALQKEHIGIDVYSMTHTCTEARTPCQNCWFCKERAWAESVLNATEIC